jgi:hypothetical protein
LTGDSVHQSFRRRDININVPTTNCPVCCERYAPYHLSQKAY